MQQGQQEADLDLPAPLLSESVTDALARCWAGCLLAVSALINAATDPATLCVVRRLALSLCCAAAAQWLLLQLLLWPLALLLKLVSLLTLFVVDLDAARLLAPSLSVYPLLTLLLTRYAYRAQLEAVFMETLARLDPGYAAHLAARPRRHKATAADRLLARIGFAGDADGDDLRTAALLLAAGLLLRGWRGLPRVGWLVAPVLQFLAVRSMVGRPWAAAAFALLSALHPAWERPVTGAAEVWAASRVLARSNLRAFLERCVPKERRGAFVRAFEYTLVSYFVLPVLLLRLPLLGPLAAFPCAGVAAYCLNDILSSRPGLKQAFDGLQ